MGTGMGVGTGAGERASASAGMDLSRVEPVHVHRAATRIGGVLPIPFHFGRLADTGRDVVKHLFPKSFVHLLVSLKSSEA